MADEAHVTDWTDLRVQKHWYRLRHELESEIESATDELRRDYDITVQLSSATITTDGDRAVLRVPVSAKWRSHLERTIAYILVTSDEEDEPRVTAVAHGIEEALQRWVQQEVPIASVPVFLYPEAEVRWPEPSPQPVGAVAEAGTAGAETPAAPA